MIDIDDIICAFIVILYAGTAWLCMLMGEWILWSIFTFTAWFIAFNFNNKTHKVC